MKPEVKKWLGILMVFIYFAGCNGEQEISHNKKDTLPGLKTHGKGSVLEIAYDKTTWQRFIGDFENFTDLDLAHINPSEEKQRVEMVLLPDGSVNMTIEEMDFERNIIIPHQTLPNDIPGIRKTVIIGNTISFYDINGRLKGTERVETPKQTELVEQIRELGGQYGEEEIARTVAAMQGGFFDRAIEKMIAQAQENGQLIQI